MTSERLTVGHFGKSYGIKGWLRVNSLTDPPENILKYLPWQIQHLGEWRRVEISDFQKRGQQIIVKISGCDTPEQAKSYMNFSIAIYRDQLPVLPPGEYYWIELIGMTVINEKGVKLGQVESLMETGSNDVLVIQGENRSLLPYTNEVIKEIKINEGIIIVDWDLGTWTK
jgi:16S rRNA processing protein RimM